MTGWKSEKLGDLCYVLNGLWKGKEPPFQTARVIRNTNFNPDGTLDDADIAVIEVESKQLAKRSLKPGDIILEKSGGGPKQAVGRVIIFDRHDTDFSFSNFTSAIRVKDVKRLHCQFLHKYLFWIYKSGFTETIQSHSTGIRNLNLSAYKSIEIPLPPLDEQRRIVAILDEAFAGLAVMRRHAEANLKNARYLFDSHLNAIFSQRGDGWVETTFDQLCDIKHGFAFKSEFFMDAGDHVLLTPGNFYEAGGYRDRGDKQKFYVGKIPDGYVLSEGDLLVAMTEQAAGLLGSPILVPESGRFLHNQRLGLVVGKPGTNWTNEFFFHVFNTKFVRQEIHDSASGVKVRHTSPGKIGEVPVSYPKSKALQLAIVAQLTELQAETTRLESLYRQKLAAIDELKQAILRRAFSGALSAKDALAA